MPKSGKLLPWLWFFIAPHRAQFFLRSAIRVFVDVTFILIPFGVLELVNLLRADLVGNLQLAYLYAGGIFLLMFVGNLLFLTRTEELMLRDTIKRDLTIFAMEHVISLPFVWHEGQGTGNKMQRIFTSRDALFSLLGTYFGQLLDFVFSMSAVMLVIFFKAPFAAFLFFFGMIGFYIFAAVFSAKKIHLWNDRLNGYFENIIGRVYEYASAIFTVKFMNLWPFVRAQAVSAETRQQKNVLPFFDFVFRRWFWLNLFGEVFFAGTVVISIWLFSRGQMDLSILLLMIWYADEVWGLLDRFADVQTELLENTNSFLRLTKFLRKRPEQADLAPLADFPADWQELKFEKVSFRYGQIDTISNLSLTVPRGQRVALVGRSGAGKSTFVKLLFKQVLPQKGSISFDQIDTKNIAKSELLSHLSVVLQDTEIFNTSIRENIQLSRSRRGGLRKYLDIAHASPFVDRLPKGVETVIGEKGVRLSGGERQRIGIARALSQEAEILVFDEATSALDTESERAIQGVMREIFAGKTSFVIAHRLSTVREVDRILVFRDGRIVEDGSFDQLVKKDGEFTKLWKLQKLS